MSRSKNNILKESYTVALQVWFFPPRETISNVELGNLSSCFILDASSPAYSDCVWGDGSEEAELQTAIMLTDNDRRQIKH